jgi:hypothetical protein
MTDFKSIKVDPGGTDGDLTVGDASVSRVRLASSLIRVEDTVANSNIELNKNGTIFIYADASDYSQLSAFGLRLDPGVIPATPALHTLYTTNMVKGWAHVVCASTTPTLQASFNVSSVSYPSSTQLRVNWDADFANTDYAVSWMLLGQAAGILSVDTFNVAYTIIDAWNSTTDGTLTLDGSGYTVTIIAVGEQ